MLNYWMLKNLNNPVLKFKCLCSLELVEYMLAVQGLWSEEDCV